MSTTTSTLFHRMSRRQRRLLSAVALAVIMASLTTALVARSGGDDRSSVAESTTTTSTTAPSGPLRFVVDESLTPSVDEVEPIEGSDVVRPVGVYAPAGGSVAELVLDEVLFHAPGPAALDAFVDRWDGQVLDSFDAEADGSQDHLVRVDVSRADVGSLAEDLLAYEDDHAGEHRASDDRVLYLLALAASEWRAGNEVVLDWLTEPASIESGEVYERSDKNVFDWSYLQLGGDMNTGVARAWQLLAERDLLGPTRSLLVLDGGFEKNPDFPRNAEIHHTNWGSQNSGSCGDNPCPWHGTDAIMAAVARVDNGYGAAGPGGPVVDSVIAVNRNLDYWTQMRRTQRYAEQYRPDAVNMSFKREVNAGRGHAERWTDRRMGNVRSAGSLPIAAAGNDGKTVDTNTLIVPCESKEVLCVGGMASDGSRHPSSNYGEGDSRTSVQIYGPYCVQSLKDPSDPSDNETRRACGTSFAAPFVAGVAMLVKAADPSLSPGEIQNILLETANVGGLGSEVTGSQRRINALAAVAAALGLEVGDPVVSIDSPTPGSEHPHTHWVDLFGSATDFSGNTLELQWASDRDGVIGTTALGLGTDSLTPGRHVISATATDRDGRTTTKTVTIEVVDTPPEVWVISPPPSEVLEVWAGTPVSLQGKTLDPDNWMSVDDAETRWVVTRSGTTVAEATGHQATVPGSLIVPGTYEVSFTAAGVTATSTFVANELPDGATPPTATIITPGNGEVFGSQSGSVPITFEGVGHDDGQSVISGTRYRWIARSGDTTKVLCQGSSVPGAGGGGLDELATVQDCATFEAELSVLPGDLAHTMWDVQLEVWDAVGLPSSPATSMVQVIFVVA